MKKLLLLFILAGAFSGYSQTTGIALSTFKPSSDAVLYAQIHEIYGDDYLQPGSGTERALLTLLRERVSLVNEPVGTKDFPLLSSLPLNNSMNPAIVPFSAAAFTVSTFNPLRYGWNFFDSRIQVYRLDGTDYVLVIQPQTITQ